MSKLLIVLALVTCQTLATDVEQLEEVVEAVGQEKSGSFTLTDGSTSNFLSNAVFVVPILIAIIFVDFAIFGAFANRSDELNPVSDFFYHVKRGLSIVRDRSAPQAYNRPHHYNRYQRYSATLRHWDTCTGIWKYLILLISIYITYNGSNRVH